MEEEQYNNQGDKIDIKVEKTKKSSAILAILVKNIKIIVVLEVILIFLFGYFFLIKAEFVSLSEEKKSISLKKDKLEEIQKYEKRLDRLASEQKKIDGQDDKYTNMLYDILPQKQNLPEIILQVQGLVNYYGLVLDDISIMAPQETDSKNQNNSNEGNEKIEEITVTVSVSGSNGGYDKLKDFLRGIERHVRLFDVTSFSFNGEMTTYSIVFKTYYLKNE